MEGWIQASCEECHGKARAKASQTGDPPWWWLGLVVKEVFPKMP